MNPMRCPKCRESSNLRHVWTLANLTRRLANGLYETSGEEIGLPRRLFATSFRCRACGHVFTDVEARARDTGCPVCGYDLTGNISGRCPECGTELSAELRARIAPPGLGGPIESADDGRTPTTGR